MGGFKGLGPGYVEMSAVKKVCWYQCGGDWEVCQMTEKGEKSEEMWLTKTLWLQITALLLFGIILKTWCVTKTGITFRVYFLGSYLLMCVCVNIISSHILFHFNVWLLKTSQFRVLKKDIQILMSHIWKVLCTLCISSHVTVHSIKAMVIFNITVYCNNCQF